MSDRGLEHAHLFLDEPLPNISNFQLNLADQQEGFLNQSFDSEELYPEPRNLSSSELSDFDEPKEKYLARESPENAKTKKNSQTKNSSSELGTSSESKSNEVSPKKKCVFTPEQDKVILNLYKMFGGNWKKISGFMGGLSPNAVKNRFYKKLKNRNLKQDTTQIDITKLTNDNFEGKYECSAEKKSQLVNLYQKVIEIENYIKNTKIQIKQMVKKNIDIPKN